MSNHSLFSMLRFCRNINERCDKNGGCHVVLSRLGGDVAFVLPKKEEITCCGLEAGVILQVQSRTKNLQSQLTTKNIKQ